MLVLTRKKDEAIVIGDDIEIIVTQITEDRVKIGIRAPKGMKIFRKELLEEVANENILSAEVQKEKIGAIKSIIDIRKEQR